MAEMIDSYVKLLLHCDGPDDATKDIDYSGFNKPLTFVNGLKLDITYKKFGVSSLLFDMPSDWYMTVPDSDDWYFDGDFTLESWIRPGDYPVDYPIFYQYVDANNQWGMYISLSGSGNYWYFIIIDGGVTTLEFHCTSDITYNVWEHIALVRNSNNWYMFVGGVNRALTLDSGAYSVSFANLAAVLTIGHNLAGDNYDGRMDEVRVSKGIARWVADFTPLTYPYSKSAIMQSM